MHNFNFIHFLCSILHFSVYLLLRVEWERRRIFMNFFIIFSLTLSHSSPTLDCPQWLASNGTIWHVDKKLCVTYLFYLIQFFSMLFWIGRKTRCATNKNVRGLKKCEKVRDKMNDKRTWTLASLSQRLDDILLVRWFQILCRDERKKLHHIHNRNKHKFNSLRAKLLSILIQFDLI